MPTARRSRTIAAPADQLWELISDPHHLPRWWPRVARVEGVTETAFTEVMRTARGKTVRADFDLVARDPGQRALRWSQRVQGTPFARVLRSAETALTLAPAPAGEAQAAAAPGAPAQATEVTIELRQTLAGFFPRFGGFLVRRAAAATIEEALDGLERISA